jgi:hypothetical protein
MGGTCSTYGGNKCIQNFGGKPEGKRRFGRLRVGYEDNIRIELTEIG